MKLYTSSDIAILKGRKIFFDANVLIYNFWSNYSNWVDKYSTIFNSLLKQGNEMFVDYIVISEVVNRVIKIEYSNFLQEKNISNKELPFKKYRNSKDGKEIIREIYATIQFKIINNFSIVGKDFTKSNLESFLIVDSMDFSDKAIAEICIENNFVLLTNDIDFIDSSLDVLSSNPRYKINK